MIHFDLITTIIKTVFYRGLAWRPLLDGTEQCKPVYMYMYIPNQLVKKVQYSTIIFAIQQATTNNDITWKMCTDRGVCKVLKGR